MKTIILKQSVDTSMSELINVNMATVEELVSVPSVGLKTARRIIRARTRLPGKIFGNLDQLLEIPFTNRNKSFQVLSLDGTQSIAHFFPRFGNLGMEDSDSDGASETSQSDGERPGSRRGTHLFNQMREYFDSRISQIESSINSSINSKVEPLVAELRRVSDLVPGSGVPRDRDPIDQRSRVESVSDQQSRSENRSDSAKRVGSDGSRGRSDFVPSSGNRFSEEQQGHVHFVKSLMGSGGSDPLGVPLRNVSGGGLRTQSGDRSPPLLRSPCDFTVSDCPPSMFQPVPARRLGRAVPGNRNNNVATGYRREGDSPPPMLEGVSAPSETVWSRAPPRVRGVNIKVPKFNGTKDWFPFIFSFERVSHSYGWCESDQLTMLLGSLEDTAMEFISLQSEEIVSSYARVKELMAQSFGVTELPQSIRRQISSLSQESKESLEEFSRRVLKLVVKGYPKAEVDIVQTLAVDTFLNNCRDKNAALLAMQKGPSNLPQAVSFMKEAINNYAAVHAGKQVRQVTFDPVITAEPKAPQILQISADSSRSHVHNSYPSVGRATPLDKSQPRRGRSKRSRSRRLQALLELIGSSSSDDEPRTASLVRSRSPGGAPVCFHCNEPGHFKRDCPKLGQDTAQQRSRSPGALPARGSFDRSKSPTVRYSSSPRPMNRSVSPLNRQ